MHLSITQTVPHLYRSRAFRHLTRGTHQGPGLTLINAQVVYQEDLTRYTVHLEEVEELRVVVGLVDLGQDAAVSCAGHMKHVGLHSVGSDEVDSPEGREADKEEMGPPGEGQGSFRHTDMSQEDSGLRQLVLEVRVQEGFGQGLA